MRADKFLSEHFGSRSKAKSALLAGQVLFRGKVLSPDDDISDLTEVVFLPADPFVSLGGDKLERGLSVFCESVEGAVVADLGASTGGFSDCVLRRGARKVYCVDVGENQLAEPVKSNPKVAVMDRTNARYLTSSDFPEPIDVVVADLSFISLRLILPAVREILNERGRAFVLFKPQFECGGKGLNGSGILPRKFHRELLKDFYLFSEALGLFPRAITPAPVKEKKNIEYVVFLQRDSAPVPLAEYLRCADENI